MYRESYRNIWRHGDDLEEIIVAEIDRAKSSIDIAVQELNLPLVAEALCDKHVEGVNVRLILENRYSYVPSMLNSGEVALLSDYARNKYDEFLRLADLNGDGIVSQEEASRRDAMFKLHSAGVPLIDDTADGSKGSGTMHHKFFVVDGRVVVFGSANFTMSGVHGDFANPTTRGNANHLLVVDDVELAKLFEEEFRIMWGDGPSDAADSRFGKQKPHRLLRTVRVDGCRIDVQFSPAPKRIPFQSTSNGMIAQIVGEASKTVDLALFVFSSQEIVDALQQACLTSPSLTVRGVYDAGFATRYYSETLDMWQMALKDRGKYEVSSETGAVNRPWGSARATTGMAILPEGDKMHHKFAVIDSEIVITGSQNWSPAANTNNDEVVLVIESRVIAAHFLREIERLSRRIHTRPTKKLMKRVKERGGMFPPSGVTQSRSPGEAPTRNHGR